MAPNFPLYVVEHRSDPNSTTGDGGWLRDSSGTWWKVVPGHVARGTADTHATVDQTGRIRIIY